MIRRGEKGSAIAGFVMVASLLIVLVAGLLQLILTLHVRNVLTDAAAEGARYGAVLTRTNADAAARTRYLIQSTLGNYDVTINAWDEVVDRTPQVRVSVQAPLPFLGFLLGNETITVSGRAIDEAGL